jgi:hypothetical protein
MLLPKKVDMALQNFFVELRGIKNSQCNGITNKFNRYFIHGIPCSYSILFKAD